MTDYQDGWFLVPGTPPSFDPTADPDAFNPFGSGGPTPTVNAVTARTLIDNARIRHHAFSDIEMPDGAAVLFLNQRQRELLALASQEVEGIVGTGIQYTIATPATGLLVSFANGVPYVGVAGQDGWATHVDENGVPYVDPNEPQLPTDPLGSTPGFPLPKEMVRLTNAMAVLRSGQFATCEVVKQQMRNGTMPGRGPVAYVAGNRLVPMRGYTTAQNASNSGDRWQGVTGFQMSYVGISVIESLDDEITLPILLQGALIADLANLFAMQSKRTTPAERREFQDRADRAAGEFVNNAFGMLTAASSNSVQYRGR